MFKLTLLVATVVLLIAGSAVGRPVQNVERKEDAERAMRAMKAMLRLHPARREAKHSRKIHNLKPLIGFTHAFNVKRDARSRLAPRRAKPLAAIDKKHMAALLKLVKANRGREVKA